MGQTEDLNENPKKSSGSHFDAILDEIGSFGRWQQFLMVLLWIPSMYCGMAFMTYSFALGTPEKYR